MRSIALRTVSTAVLAFVGMLTATQPPSVAGEPDDEWSTSLAGIHPIDVHAHAFAADPALSRLLSQLDLRLLDIVVVDDRQPFLSDRESELREIFTVARSNSGRIALCTSVNWYDFEKPGFSRKVIRQLDEDFARGAAAVKINKVIGMEIKTKAGKYLMPDDPVLAPILDDISARNRTVIAHVAEPTSAWQPPNPDSPDYAYYKQHPMEYAYLHPEWPSKDEILRARDHLLEKHPKLRVVGAHLGSMELDVDEIAKRFDRYPNFAVDTAARIPYLMLQDREKVRAFLVKYQDRVLYGTDFVLEPGANPTDAINSASEMYRRDWKFFATNDAVNYNGHEIKGLGLPASVVRKLYHDNAVRWFPGILGVLK